jgi:histidyl-tRNA synthetase
MFRYERPQRGRYRQFHQLGVEVLGLETALADVECLDLAWNILRNLKLSERCILEINTLGDAESRTAYRTALVKYLTPFKDQLSDDSKLRFEKSPMRILDSKDEGDKKIVANAPQMKNYLNESSKKFFADVLGGLEKLKIPYQVNPKLVRGLDYYCHTVFEFTTTELGAQSAILSGGRYDGLVEMLGGPKIAGVGWAAGVDRLADLCSTSLAIENYKPISVIARGDRALVEAIQISSFLRNKNRYCEVFLTGSFKKKLERANKLNTSIAILIFEQENGSFEYKIKNFENGEEESMTLQELLFNLG